MSYNHSQENRKRRLSGPEKERLIGMIADFLGSNDQVLFAYIFGSFSSGEAFRDIDVGVFFSEGAVSSPLMEELRLETALENICRIPVDVRIINHAPVMFLYHVLKNGIVIVDKDRDRRSDFEGLVYKKYFDMRHLRDEYLREIIHAPI